MGNVLLLGAEQLISSVRKKNIFLFGHQYEYFVSAESDALTMEKVVEDLYLFVRQESNFNDLGLCNFTIKNILEYVVVYPSIPSKNTISTTTSYRYQRNLLYYYMADEFIMYNDVKPELSKGLALVRLKFSDWKHRKLNAPNSLIPYFPARMTMVREGHRLQGTYMGNEVSLVIYKMYNVNKINPSYNGGCMPNANDLCKDVAFKNYIYELSVCGPGDEASKIEGIEMILKLTEKHLKFHRYDIKNLFRYYPEVKAIETPCWDYIVWHKNVELSDLEFLSNLEGVFYTDDIYK